LVARGDGLTCYEKNEVNGNNLPSQKAKTCSVSEDVCYAQFREGNIITQGCKRKFSQFEVGKCVDGLEIESGSQGGFHDGGSIVTTCQCDDDLCNTGSNMAASLTIIASLVVVALVYQ